MPLEVFKCTTENEKRLSELRKCAEAQQAKTYKEFEDYLEERKIYDALTCKEQETTPKPIERMPDFILYPWENKCAGDEFMYVSYEEREECPFIKGWMHVRIRIFNSRVRNRKTRRIERSTLTIAHVNYISTNQNKTKVPPGVGREMMSFMEQHMLQENCHFVELMPLPDVVGFYKKLGYKLEFKDVNYYTKWFVDKEPYTRSLELYTHELNDENKKITKEMEKAEQESFQDIYDQLTPDEQLIYHRQQEEDSFTRMSYIFIYDESGIEEVKKLLV